MLKDFYHTVKELRFFLILWSTQSLSALGSAMTNFALVLWAYEQSGSALATSLLAVCSYAPYVLLSVFAGALTDKWNKKIVMLASDSFAAACTAAVLALHAAGRLEIWHLYVLNALNGLMNTVQQPASDVAVSLLAPQRYYQQASGLRSFSHALVTVLTPVFAAALFGFCGLRAVVWVDLGTFILAFTALLCFIALPDPTAATKGREASVFAAARSGLGYLWQNRGILDLILFLAIINFTASAYNAALPALVLPRPEGERALALVNTATGIAALAGSVLVSLLPAPKSRVRVILNSLLFSMGTENFLLAFGGSVPVWCLGAVLGWLFIPVMNANMDVLLRTNIPVHMQGRVYAARNTLQFFTIPVGYLMGGFLVDRVFEPFMEAQPAAGFLCRVFGTGKGAGAALLFLVLGVFGVATCLPFRADRHIRALER